VNLLPPKLRERDSLINDYTKIFVPAGSTIRRIILEDGEKTLSLGFQTIIESNDVSKLLAAKAAD
jgi:hypothetical protein